MWIKRKNYEELLSEIEKLKKLNGELTFSLIKTTTALKEVTNQLNDTTLAMLGETTKDK